MPYKDPLKNRDYQREYSRLRRRPAGACQTPGQAPLPAEFRLKTARDILHLLEEQVVAVREDLEARTLEKARVIGFLAGVALKAVEAADLDARVEALETVLKLRKESDSCRPQSASTIN